MPSVDDRIVRMEFDNAAFERKTATTLASLDKLNKALKFEGATKGLADVSAAAGKVHFGTIADGIEGVSKKFLALSTIGITVLSNITTKAISSGIQIAKSLSLDQIISGFSEYETNMRSIQTVLANTKADGTNLEQVNAALDKLNEFSDKTIFNFGEMARNIGTFTAAGVDLDTSVQSIKGIANLAAISGSSSEQASTAMYQLSQAISTGTLRLMDWNSVVNAGMGGEVFQKALFESGKALKTIEGVGIDTTFEQWTSAGNSFRSSLEQGWLTSEVLTTTLQGFTGEMNEAQLMAKGFTKEQAANIIELGKTGVDAATQVRTFTQLMQTTKESIGSGWSASFRILIGDFEEATAMFTQISGAIGKWVGENADARNKILQDWKDLGGGMVLFDSLRRLLQNLGDFIRPIKGAFREIFPKKTGKDLFELTMRFSQFVDMLKPSPTTINILKNVFQAFFSILNIGWEIIKQGVKFVGSLLAMLSGAAGGAFSGFIRDISDFFVKLAESLVKGDAIKAFFEDLLDIVKDIPGYIVDLKDKIVGLFTGVDVDLPDQLGEGFGRLGDRAASLPGLFDKVKDIWRPVQDVLEKIIEILGDIWEELSSFFVDLGQNIADAMGEGDFDAVMDIINVGLLGGIGVILGKFFKSGIKLDFGGGFLGAMKDAFSQLTGVLKAMQTDIKANALLKIAGAIAILTASVLVLSTIDSEALTKALTAMAVGFGQLMGAFAILTKMQLGPSSAASFAILAVGMGILAGAMLLLSVATKSLSELSWGEIAKGLFAVTAIMTALVGVTHLLKKDMPGLIAAGFAMILMGVAMNLFAGAVKIFASMSAAEIGKGVLAIAIGVTSLALALRLMPKDVGLQGIALLLIAFSLDKLADVIEVFADMSWNTIIKGFASVSGGIALLGAAMRAMPEDMLLRAAGLFIVSLALVAIGEVMEKFADMSWGEIIRGLVGMAGSLLIIGIAANAMSGAIGGAVAIGIIAGSMLLLLEVVKGFASIKFGDLLRGMLGIAIALGVLAGVAYLIQPAIGPMFLLGAALIAIGAGFALFGFGAAQVAKAFELFAKVGPKGAKAFVTALKSMGEAIPALATGLAKGIGEMIIMIGDMAPEIAKALGKIIGSLIDQLTKLVPKFGKLIEALLTTLLGLLRKFIPQIVLLGTDIVLGLLRGIRDRMFEIVDVALDIITEFINGLTANIQQIIDAGVDFLLAFLEGIAENIIKIQEKVLEIILEFVGALANNAQQVIDAGADMIVDLVQGISDNTQKIIDAGFDALVDFLGGITDNLTEVTEAVGTLITSFIGAVEGEAVRIADAGTDMLVTFITEVGENSFEVLAAVTTLITNFITALGQNALRIVNAGFNALLAFLKGLSKKTIEFTNACIDIIVNFCNAMASTIRNRRGDLEAAGKNLASAVLDGVTMGWSGRIGRVAQDLAGGLKSAVEAAKGPAFLHIIGDPYSMLTMHMGESLINGYTRAFDRDKTLEASAGGLITRTAKALEDSAAMLDASTEFNPTITPVLDLTSVMAGARTISDLVQTQPLTPTFSYDQARRISLDTIPIDEGMTSETGVPRGVNFEQNIYAPTQLSTADIYKQTRNQIEMAKEELNVP